MSNLVSPALSRRPLEYAPATLSRARLRGRPWFSMVFLFIAFFLIQHDFYFSLLSHEGFSPSLGEFTEKVEDGNLLRRLVLIVVGCWGIVVTALYRERSDAIGNPWLGWLIRVFLVWSALSFAWSVDPGLTGRRIIVLSMLCIGAYAISWRFSLRDFVVWVAVSSFGYLHVGILAELILGTFHPFSGEYRFSGTLHPNSQAINCALLLLATGTQALESDRWRTVYLAVLLEATVFLLLTKSRTCLVLTPLAPFLFWLLTERLPTKVAFSLLAAFIGTTAMLGREVIVPLVTSTLSSGRADSEMITLTGRIPLWSQLFRYIEQRPLLGYGYDSFWTSRYADTILATQDWVVTQAHSTYVELLLSLGLVGLLLYVAISFGVVWVAVRYRRRGASLDICLVGSLVIFALLNGLMESVMIMSNMATLVVMVGVSKLVFSLRASELYNSSLQTDHPSPTGAP
ncbi:MAG: O-antigen ligase family protein [Bdellovibrionales bacterium]|nr:O-antigen ligase family protein [Bdellovibrionales bacterium]